MEGAQFLLEGALVLLLAATLFHAMRLERALGVLKRDRAVLEELVAGFNESTRAAEAGIERLRTATDGAGRQIARQIEQAQRLRDDLGFLSERGERLAERLEGGVRAARMYADQQPGNLALSAPAFNTVAPSAAAPGASARPAPAASPVPQASPVPAPSPVLSFAMSGAGGTLPEASVDQAGTPRLRSEAERELLRALRAAR